MAGEDVLWLPFEGGSDGDADEQGAVNEPVLVAVNSGPKPFLWYHSGVTPQGLPLAGSVLVTEETETDRPGFPAMCFKIKCFNRKLEV